MWKEKKGCMFRLFLFYEQYFTFVNSWKIFLFLGKNISLRAMRFLFYVCSEFLCVQIDLV